MLFFINHFLHFCCFFFFFNDTATTEIYTLSLHDALPISRQQTHGSATAAHHGQGQDHGAHAAPEHAHGVAGHAQDRKSTRLNSSHSQISYAVFCLKKKKKKERASKTALVVDS